jgi:anti-anti-sigma factor
VSDEIVVHRDGSRVAVLELVGEHDDYSARKIAATIEALFGEGRHVIMDLRRTTFLDSTTVSKLLIANAAAQSHRLGFALVVSSSSGWPVRTMFEVAHLDEVMAIEPTLASAVTRIRARGSERRSSGERRSTMDRRQQSNTVPRVERRSGGDRRIGSDRRRSSS